MNGLLRKWLKKDSPKKLKAAPVFVTQVKTITAAVVVLGLLGSGTARPSGEATWQPRANLAPHDTTASKQLVKVASPVEGTVTVVGREVKEGETVPADQLVSVRTRQGEKKYRRLRVGDRVEAGRVLAVLDDRLARNELAVQKAKLAAAQAEYEAAERTAQEAQARLDRLDALRAQSVRSVKPEDYPVARANASNLLYFSGSHYDFFEKSRVQSRGCPLASDALFGRVSLEQAKSHFPE
jgi:multidrug efflux pump subunit AcrA (membrane-fusion protein)